MALTAINLAKIVHWIPLVDKQSEAEIPRLHNYLILSVSPLKVLAE